jgi:signal transduction histidine kinase
VTIRGKVTLWYSVVLLVSFMLAGGGMFYELVYERDVAQKKRQQQEPMEEEVGEVLLFYILPALIVTVLGGWWLLRGSLRPLQELTLAAERINAENLQEALPRSFNGDEVDRLSEILNATNNRLFVAMNEIYEFTLHASHELKTPLTVLHSEIEISLASELPGAQRRSLENQLGEIHRLTRIVESLTLLARANSGQMRFTEEKVAFHEVVREIADDAIILGSQKRIQVELKQLDEGWVTGDRDRLRQMLLNLAENACKYNEPGGSIIFSLRREPKWLIFEIANTGKGISPEEIPNVFNKFYRGLPHRDADSSGLGLGLCIAKSIVNGHHGEIAFDVSRPCWTTVRVALPLNQELSIPAPNHGVHAQAIPETPANPA